MEVSINTSLPNDPLVLGRGPVRTSVDLEQEFRLHAGVCHLMDGEDEEGSGLINAAQHDLCVCVWHSK